MAFSIISCECMRGYFFATDFLAEELDLRLLGLFDARFGAFGFTAERAFLLELRLVDRLGALGAAAVRGRERLRDFFFLGAFGLEADRALLLLLERLGALGAAAARALEERLRDLLAFLLGALGEAAARAFELLRERLRLRALLER